MRWAVESPFLGLNLGSRAHDHGNCHGSPSASTVKTLSSDQRVEHLQKIQSAYNKCKEYSDDKVQLAMQTYEMVSAGCPRHTPRPTRRGTLPRAAGQAEARLGLCSNSGPTGRHKSASQCHPQPAGILSHSGSSPALPTAGAVGGTRESYQFFTPGIGKQSLGGSKS